MLELVNVVTGNKHIRLKTEGKLTGKEGMETNLLLRPYIIHDETQYSSSLWSKMMMNVAVCVSVGLWVLSIESSSQAINFMRRITFCRNFHTH